MKKLSVFYLIALAALLGFDFAAPSEIVLITVYQIVGLITCALGAVAAIVYLVGEL